MRSILLSLVLFYSSLGFAVGSYEIKSVQLPEQNTVVKQTKTSFDKLPDFFASTFPAVAKYLADLHVAPASAPFSRYFKFSPTEIELEAGFMVPSQLKGSGDIVASTISGGDYALTIHVGAYDKIGGAYQALHAWIAENSKTENGAPFEVYIDDPGLVTPEQMRTEVYYPFR